MWFRRSFAKQDSYALYLKSKVRDIPDFPIPGILFRDITPLLNDRLAVSRAVKAMAQPFRHSKVDLVAGIESRGFLFGMPIAYLLGAGFVPLRKAGKLPYKIHSLAYRQSYGENTLAIHVDAVHPGQRVVVVDDVLASGGTANAANQLLSQLGASLIGATFLIELTALHGRSSLGLPNVHVVIQY